MERRKISIPSSHKGHFTKSISISDEKLNTEGKFLNLINDICGNPNQPNGGRRIMYLHFYSTLP
jgi:hypothetical protein